MIAVPLLGGAGVGQVDEAAHRSAIHRASRVAGRESRKVRRLCNPSQPLVSMCAFRTSSCVLAVCTHWRFCYNLCSENDDTLVHVAERYSVRGDID